MTPENLIVAALVLPLVALLLINAFGEWPNVREACMLAVSGMLFLVTCGLASHVFAGERPMWSVGEMIPGFEIAFKVEPLGMLFALVASGLWILTSVYAIGYMRGHHEQHQTRFYCCFAIAIFAAMAAAFSSNLFTLFVAYELMTVSTYPLVTHHGTKAARDGGRVYLGILLSTSIAFFMLAVAWTWFLAGTLDFTPGGILNFAYADGKINDLQLGVLLGLFAFGIGKAALMPFHRWLPAAMVAPTPVSALLHAVAVVKVGVFSVLKVVVYIFGIDLLQLSGVSVWLAYVAGATILIASLVAMSKDNLKARLAYSTISQLAYITLGAALATPNSVIGGGMHIAMHAVGKITLFFCAGAIYVAAHKTNISELRGLGRKMPFTFAAFLVAAVSIIGLPPGGGAWSKWFLAIGTVEAHLYLLLAALMISSLLNIAYLIPIPIRAFMAPLETDSIGDHNFTDSGDTDSGDTGSGDTDSGDTGSGIQEAPWMCVVPLCITALLSVMLFFSAEWIYDVLLPITTK
nr:proton-conducting transporter membrane subunit [Novipirellula aureliae]